MAMVTWEEWLGVYMAASSSYLGARLGDLLETGFLMWEKGEGNIRFAVTAPRGVELYKNIFLVVNDDFLVIVGHHDLNIALLLLRNGLGLDAWIDLARDEIIDELANVLRRELLALVKGEFLVLDGLLDREGGPFVGFEVEIGRVGAKGFGIDGGEADSTLVLFCDRLEGLG